LDRRLGERQGRSGRGGEEKNSQPLPGLKPPVIQPIEQRYTTELSRLLLTAYSKAELKNDGDKPFAYFRPFRIGN
jgi:hypothetical protein